MFWERMASYIFYWMDLKSAMMNYFSLSVAARPIIRTLFFIIIVETSRSTSPTDDFVYYTSLLFPISSSCLFLL